MKLSSRETPDELRQRIVGAGILMTLAFAAIAVRLLVLQVGQGESWTSLSESNRIRVARVPATRGVIYDRNGEPLVDNRSSFDVVVTPEDARDLEATIAQVSEFLGAAPPTSAQVLKAARQRPAYEATVLFRDVGFDQAVVPLETHRLEWPGVSLEVGPVRTYPYGPVASHLLGYVGEVSEVELALRHDYRMGDLIGKFGAEKAFEDLLRGAPGGQQLEVDALGRKLRVLSRVPESPGTSIALTLDRRLQQFVEQLLEGQEGAIVVLDPNTGGVLAMASRPSFDPNVFARGIGRQEWHRLVGDKLKPLNNRAVQGQYPPGSTFKIVTAAAALDTGIINPFTRLYCPGHYHFANRDFRCWKSGGHGSVDLHEAIVQSCDVYFYQVAQRLGIDTIAEYARRLGLGVPTGIALDHEKGGLIPSSEWKRRVRGEPWFAGETLSVGIGQGYVLATPLQMARLIATVANGGTVYRPRYVARIEPSSGEPAEETTPEVVGRAGLRPTTLLALREALRDVVNSPTGTGKKARLPTIEVAGKTGTSQSVAMGRQRVKSSQLRKEQRDHAWFVAFAPVEAPEIAIAVLIEHASGGGGAIAAPIARGIADFYFALTRGRAYEVAGTAGGSETIASLEPATGGSAAAAASVEIPLEVRASAARLGLAPGAAATGCGAPGDEVPPCG